MTTVKLPDLPAAEIQASTLAPAVSAVLSVWDRLQLEVGEVAVVTDGHPWSRLAALAATWYGALPVVFLTDSVADIPGVTRLSFAGQETNARELAALLGSRPAVAAAELGGTAGMVDLLLETLPRSSRLMLAGHAGERLTIDYYLNVHIKGVRLVSTVLGGDDHFLDPGLNARTGRLLARPAIEAACRAALAVGPGIAGVEHVTR
jgi:hypothetical protein